MATIAQLLWEGRRTLGNKAAAEREEAERQGRRGIDNWRCLVESACDALGHDLVAASSLGGEIPTDFGSHSYSHAVSIRPFVAGEIACRFYRRGDRTWEAACWDEASRSRGERFAVRQGYFAERDGDSGCCLVDWKGTASTNDLAEAVALCELQTTGYLEALAHCERENSAAEARERAILCKINADSTKAKA